MEISIATVFLYYVFKAAVSYPTVLVCVYPSFFSNSSTFCLKSPCTMISPSLALPPTPHLLLRNLPSSFKSSSVPINPVTRVTTLPPRFLRSNCTRRRCWDGWRVVCSSRLVDGRERRAGRTPYRTGSCIYPPEGQHHKQWKRSMFFQCD